MAAISGFETNDDVSAKKNLDSREYVLLLMDHPFDKSSNKYFRQKTKCSEKPYPAEYIRIW